MCSGKRILAESQHAPSPYLQSCPNFICAVQAHLPRRAFPIPCPREELAPGGCVSLWGTSDSSLFGKSLTVLRSKQLCVFFSARNIFNQLKSRLLQQPLQSLAVSMGREQNELTSVLAAPAAKERHQSHCRYAPFRVMFHWDQPPACSSGVVLPGDRAASRSQAGLGC